MDEKKPDTFVATLRALGRVTIPDEYRKLWNLERGDMVELQILTVTKPELLEENQGGL